MDWTSAEDAFAAWTRDGVIWSDWAKPVAFVTPALKGTPPAEPVPAIALPPMLDPSAVVLVDLPGPESVAAGVALAERGWCPVPLFNGTAGPSAVIDVDAIGRALIASAGRLRTVAIAPGAPPAFLLDSRRLERTGLTPGKYDNRWVALPQDFPSGALVASRGLRSAILIRRGGLSVPADLAHVLARWVEHGIRVRVIDLGTGQSAENVTVPRPSRFKLAWYAAIALMGLRRSNVGGFGATIPEQTASSGGFG